MCEIWSGLSSELDLEVGGTGGEVVCQLARGLWLPAYSLPILNLRERLRAGERRVGLKEEDGANRGVLRAHHD